MDPPSYGRGPKGEVWQIEDKLYGLVELYKSIIRQAFILLNKLLYNWFITYNFEHILDATVARKAKRRTYICWRNRNTNIKRW